jgi:hypothetical protein
VVTPERKAELRLLLDSRVEKWKSDVGWWAAVAEELLDALGAREQTPTAGGAQAGRADEAADTAGASAAGEKPGALTLAYEYLRSWRAHHVASGKSAAHLAGFDEALTHLAAAPEREIQPPAPVALPGLSEGELVREAMGLLMAATTDQVLIHIIDLRADYQQLVRERGEAWLATKTVEARAEVARVTAERDAFRDNAQAAIRLVVERVTPGEANRLTAELARLGEEYDHLDHDTRNKLESLAHDHAKAVAERDDARGKLARVAAILHTARDPGPGGWSENRAVQAALALLEE